jgi:D-alanyl-lipoteichoic acid acyltransferase DltB (MBOAT superfamily)
LLSFSDIFGFDPKHPMIFTTPLFWMFFGVVLLAYQFLYPNPRLRNGFLLVFSVFFYYKSVGYFTVLLLLTAVIDYTMGWQIYRTETRWKKKAFIILSLCLNLGLLSYFKYAYFFANLLNESFGWNLQPVDYLAAWSNAWAGTGFDIFKIIAPAGISFYTFQSISYSVDIYRGHMKPVNRFLDFAFFVSFFPQLVAGPIVRAYDFVPQIDKPYRVSAEEFNHAVWLILGGLVKKILVSDYIAANFVDRVFDSPETYTGFENLMAVYGYTIQIYCDFSGYTDIAIGVALLLGYRLTLNFLSPYSAVNITDFWRRWHISLSTWLRDYLYISLGGNRKGKIRQYLNLLITMLLGGLWHGANLKFIIWGGLHGLALAFHKMWMELTNTKGQPGTGVGRFVSQVVTFHFVAFCWMFFRARDPDQGAWGVDWAKDVQMVWRMLDRMANHFEPQLVLQQVAAYRFIFLIMAAAYLIHWMRPGTKRLFESWFGRVPDLAKAAVIVLIILALYQVKTDTQPFIYFQF